MQDVDDALNEAVDYEIGDTYRDATVARVEAIARTVRDLEGDNSTSAAARLPGAPLSRPYSSASAAATA